jgi:hypothetical protein
MLRIVAQGDDVHHLVESGGRCVGWIRGAAIRIGAFATDREAMAAAVSGARVIDDYLRGGAHRRTTPAAHAGEDAVVDVPADGSAAGSNASQDVRLVHDGAYEWVVVARRPLARLIRPRAPREVSVVPEPSTGANDLGVGVRTPAPGATTHDFALEFVVPASVAPVTRVTLARVLHRALAHGDGMRSGGSPVDGPPAAPEADLASRTRHVTEAGARSGARLGPSARPRAVIPRREDPDPTNPPPAA